MKSYRNAFPGGLDLPTHKELSNNSPAILVPLPERIILPLQQHIGLPALPQVRVGDRVLKGQPVARSERFVSVPLHASTSGKVIDIGDYPVPHPPGQKAPCIVIEPDGEDSWFDIQPTLSYEQKDPAQLHRLIQECGIVGLGGAGFPAHVKIQEGVENEVDTLIINGVECEPYITCDDRLIREKAQYVVAGTNIIAHAVQTSRSIIAVEEDMPEAAQALQEQLQGDIELVTVPSRFPAGGEKQLVQTLTGREVPSGGLAIHIGVVVHNVATAAAVFRAVTRGEPIVSRYLTVTGEVEQPRNVQVLLGTPVADCVRLCDQRPLDDREIIVGGPMMGSRLQSMDVPITKMTNCVMVVMEKHREAAQPCIRCDRCADVCPVRLQPQELYRLIDADALENARDYHLFDCIECGCCAYVCPSQIPLVHYYRYAKSGLAMRERNREGADRARARFLAREERLQREREQQLGAPVPRSPEQRRAYVEEAVDRARKRRTEDDSADP